MLLFLEDVLAEGITQQQQQERTIILQQRKQ